METLNARETVEVTRIKKKQVGEEKKQNWGCQTPLQYYLVPSYLLASKKNGYNLEEDDTNIDPAQTMASLSQDNQTPEEGCNKKESRGVSRNKNSQPKIVRSAEGIQ